MKTKNVLKRDSKSFIFKALIDTNVCKAGDYLAVKKDATGYHGINNRTGQTFTCFPSMLRNANVVDLRTQWNYTSW